MAPKGKDRNPSGLGRAIINRKTKDAKTAIESGLYTTDVDRTTRLQSITQERDLDEFLNTATLAGTQFTAERRNVKIISAPAGSQHNPYLLSEEEEKSTLKKHQENKQRLRVPRRPPWTKNMTTVQLDRQEREAFLEWRRGLAQLQEQENFLLTPFERNIEVWRQLWRVLERSHLVVQIVDARNPLRFRCEDLEAYVRDVEGAEGEHGSGPGKRRNLLLINKADLLTAKQRRLWADYFDEQGIQYAFFSAANATALQQARREQLADEEDVRQTESDEEEDDSEDEENATNIPPDTLSQVDDGDSEGKEEEEISEDGEDKSDWEDAPDNSLPGTEHSLYFSAEEDTPDGQDPRARVLTVLELEELFKRVAPDLSEFTDSSGNHPTKLVVGLVGYPNVGKSSTINSLIGEKKVSVSSTPGKTKHFQTIQLSPNLVLCDCPGLVFPQFATTRADLVCDGVLPIDQLREHTGPTALVVKRIPKEVLEAIYGLSIRAKPVEEGGNGKIAAEDLLVAYAIARGFTRSGQGNPDEARAARYILKDYVNAKLLYCHPPPGIDEDEFNAQTRHIALQRAVGKKRAPTTRVVKSADTFVPSGTANSSQTLKGDTQSTPSGRKSSKVDQEFFSSNSALSSKPFMQRSAQNGQEFTRAKLYPHQNTIADDGTPLSGRRARIAAVLANAGAEVASGKKHHKKMKRVKQRSGKGYD
ncbi:P-loop containing nucleoside triphosphate hydrolase protein [Panus rudis PR-1116 ss-1]|nr:P-loop containing nucleoside triphosphate hydrolase protein [Panus rudis PR-1116 ss-1]